MFSDMICSAITKVTVWLSGNVLVSINKVALHRPD